MSTTINSVTQFATAGTTVADGQQESSSFQGQEYDPYSFSKEMERLDNMQKTLDGVKHQLHQANMKSLLLNADIVTMFDPVATEQLKKVAMECKDCADRIEQMQQTDLKEIQEIKNANVDMEQSTHVDIQED